MAEFVDYEVWLGTFEGENFVWKVIKKFNDFKQASKFYTQYTDKQKRYTAEELQKIWSSPRIDVELRQGKKLLNWIGMYNRKIEDEPEPEEEDEHPRKEQVMGMFTPFILSYLR